MSTTRAVCAVALAISLAVTACGSESDGVTGDETSSSGGGSMIEYDERMSATVVGMSRRGEGRRLAALTDFAWDAVYLYSEGASSTKVEQDVGTGVLSDDYYYAAGNLLVFVRDEQVKRAVSVVPDLLTWEGTNRFSPEAKLTPVGSQDSSQLLRVEEP